MLKKDDPDRQLVYYQVRHPIFFGTECMTQRTFVGGYRNIHVSPAEAESREASDTGVIIIRIPQIATPFASRLRKKMDMALGMHIDAHIMGKITFVVIVCA